MIPPKFQPNEIVVAINGQQMGDVGTVCGEAGVVPETGIMMFLVDYWNVGARITREDWLLRVNNVKDPRSPQATGVASKKEE
jgi:hypothetical protein